MNFFATKATIVTIESEENDKKIVATHKWMLRHKNELKANISIITKEFFYRDRKWKICGRSQGKFVTTRDSIFQQKVLRAIRSKEDYVAT